MSKMPAKKKSCFQITSVTQAQVAASSATDDTESLDDPDEARTEDGSSEIFDVSRADYEPVCDRSSSEEAINNVGETDAPGVMVPQHIPQVNQLSALPNNPNGGSRNIGYAGSASSSQQGHDPGAALMSALVTQPGPVQQQRLPPGVSVGGGPPSLSVNVSHAAPVTYSTPSSTTATVSCSSRFRVIKLDHGTGEPFRRGRWTCTEFYEKDSEGSVMGRSVDNIRHANAAPDPSLDRDSGLGHIGGSAVIPATNFGQGLGSLADMMLSLPASRMQTLDALQQQMHQAAYATGQPGGTASQNAFSSSIKSIAVSTPQQPAVGLLQPSVGHSSLSQGGVNMQKTALSQPAGQASAATSSQTEYYHHQQQQLHASPMQEAPPSSLTLAQSGRQGPSPIITQMLGRTSASGQSGEMAGPGGGGPLPVLSAPSLLPPPPGGGLGGVGGSALQQAGGQYTSPGQLQPHNLEHAPSGGQNVPAASSSVPTTVPAGAPSASSAAMPNLMTSSLLMAKQAQFSRGQLGAFGVFGALVPGKDLMKPLIPESLHLSSPTVRSLFGIPLPMDGEEDSASGTSVVAIDNKIEQAMDLVKSHLMYAVREEVEVLKEQIKELLERNSVLERENVVLKSISNTDQLSQLSTPPASCAGGTPPQQPGLGQAQAQHQSQSHSQLQHPHSAPQTQSPQTQSPQTQPPQTQPPQTQPPQTQPPQTQPPQTQPPQTQSPQTQPHLDPSQPPQPNFTSA